MSTEAPTDLPKRRKVIYITHQRLLRLLLTHKIFAHHIVVPQPKGLPETAVITGMFLDHVRAAYGLTVCDSSFDVIPDGVESPELMIDWITVDIQRPEGREKP